MPESSNPPVVIVVQASSPPPITAVNPVTPSITPSLVTEGGRVGPTGAKGDPGIKGDKGDSGGNSIVRNAAIPLSGHRAVLIDSNGLANYASSTDLSHAPRIVGISTHAVEAGSPLIIAIHEEVVEPSWNWDVSKLVYLRENGYLTQSVPNEASNAFSLVIGFPLSPTSLFINLGIPITLIN